MEAQKNTREQVRSGEVWGACYRLAKKSTALLYSTRSSPRKNSTMLVLAKAGKGSVMVAAFPEKR